jgi:hypothetical protein
MQGATGATGAQGLAGAPGFTPAYGSFYDMTSQGNPSINSVNVMTFSNTSVATAGVSVATGPKGKSQVLFSKSGTYNIQFSAQLFTSTKASVEQIDIWLAKNGTSELNTNTQVQVHSSSDKTGKAVAAWNFLVTVAAGDYCELKWVADAPSMSLASVAATLTPTGVAIPSVILTVVQVG